VLATAIGCASAVLATEGAGHAAAASFLRMAPKVLSKLPPAEGVAALHALAPCFCLLSQMRAPGATAAPPALPPSQRDPSRAEELLPLSAAAAHAACDALDARSAGNSEYQLVSLLRPLAAIAQERGGSAQGAAAAAAVVVGRALRYGVRAELQSAEGRKIGQRWIELLASECEAVREAVARCLASLVQKGERCCLIFSLLILSILALLLALLLAELLFRAPQATRSCSCGPMSISASSWTSSRARRPPADCSTSAARSRRWPQARYTRLRIPPAECCFLK